MASFHLFNIIILLQTNHVITQHCITAWNTVTGSQGQRAAVDGAAVASAASWSTSPTACVARRELSLQIFTTPLASPLARNWGLGGVVGAVELVQRESHSHLFWLYWMVQTALRRGLASSTA